MTEVFELEFDSYGLVDDESMDINDIEDIIEEYKKDAIKHPLECICDMEYTIVQNLIFSTSDLVEFIRDNKDKLKLLNEEELTNGMISIYPETVDDIRDRGLYCIGGNGCGDMYLADSVGALYIFEHEDGGIYHYNSMDTLVESYYGLIVEVILAKYKHM